MFIERLFYILREREKKKNNKKKRVGQSSRWTSRPLFSYYVAGRTERHEPAGGIIDLWMQERTGPG